MLDIVIDMRTDCLFASQNTTHFLADNSFKVSSFARESWDIVIPHLD